MALSQLRIYGPVTTAERDAMVSGGNTVPTYTIVFNSDTGQFELWTGSAWQTVPGGAPTFFAALDIANATYMDSAAISTAVPLFTSACINSAQGADVASANDLTLGTDGNTFEITGATQVNAIDTNNWQFGSQVTLLFTSTPTVKHNTAGGAGTLPILLAGAVDFVASAGDTLTLVLSDIGIVQAWREIGRAVI